jgi:energy-coupling factor transporter transmembrane protein EcfT
MNSLVESAKQQAIFLSKINNLIMALAVAVYLALVVVVIIERAWFGIVIFSCILLGVFLLHISIRVLLTHLEIFRQNS